MGDPVGAMQHARDALDADGSVMLVEPFAGDTLAANLNPSGASTTPPRRSSAPPIRSTRPSGGGSAPRRARSAWPTSHAKRGFTRFERAAETPFNLILQAR